MRVVLYSNEVIPAKLRIDQLFYRQKEDIQIVFLPLVLEENHKQEHYQTIKRYYEGIGLSKVDYLDFTRINLPENLDTLYQYDVFHFSGGNTLETLSYIQKNGYDKVLKNLITEDKIFIGHCGGAVLLSKNASWIRLRTEPLWNVLDAYKNYETLGIVPFEFIPHYNRFKKEKHFIQQVVEYSIGIKNPIYLCNDGDGLLFESGNIQFIGDFMEISHGKISHL